MSEEKKYPEAIVGALIINKEKKILLAKSKKWKDKWTVFGGHIELGEKLEDAIIREVKEETGLDVKVVAPLGFSDSVYAKDFHEKKHFVFIDYLCEYSSEDRKIKVNHEYEDDYKWIDVEDALKLNLGGGTRLIIEEYKEYKKNKDCMNGWKRTQADFENYKKDQVKMMGEFRKYASLDMIMQILPVLDNFNASLEHVPEDQKDNAWVTGIIYIKKQLEDVLKNDGVEEIEAKAGDEFDSTVHEAVKRDTNDANVDANSPNMQIKSVVWKGYKIDGKVIRAARVIVS